MLIYHIGNYDEALDENRSLLGNIHPGTLETIKVEGNANSTQMKYLQSLLIHD